MLRKFSAFIAEPSYGLGGVPNTFVWAVAMVGVHLEVRGVGCCTVVVGRILGGVFPLLVVGVGLWTGGAGSL